MPMGRVLRAVHSPPSLSLKNPHGEDMLLGSRGCSSHAHARALGVSSKGGTSDQLEKRQRNGESSEFLKHTGLEQAEGSHNS